MKNLRTLVTIVTLSALVLSFDCALPAFKHQGFMQGILIWLSTTCFAFSGPFAILIFQIPITAYPIDDVPFFLSIAIVLFGVTTYYIRHNDKLKLNPLILALAIIWIILGANYSTFGILMSI